MARAGRPNVDEFCPVRCLPRVSERETAGRCSTFETQRAGLWVAGGRNECDEERSDKHKRGEPHESVSPQAWRGLGQMILGAEPWAEVPQALDRRREPLYTSLEVSECQNLQRGQGVLSRQRRPS